MKPLNVRLDDAQYDLLKQRAEAAGMTVSNYVRDWIDASGGDGTVPTVATAADETFVVLSPPEPSNVSRETVSVDVLDVTSATSGPGASGGKEYQVIPHPPFLAAPVDECPLCSHDRQESDHLGGRPCKFKTSPRRNCGCTFEGF